jgi:hypothetical protein
MHPLKTTAQEIRATVWCPSEFRHAMEVALVKALTEQPRTTKRKVFTPTEMVTADHEPIGTRLTFRLDGRIGCAQYGETPASLLTADWFSEAPRATGEEAELYPDDADEELVAYAVAFERGGLEAVARIIWRQWRKNGSYESFSLAMRVAEDVVAEADTVPWSEMVAIQTDEATVEYLQRDDAPRVRVAWTEQDENRVVLMNLRYRWLDTVRMLARKNRKTVEVVREYPAAKAIVQQAEALKARHAFQEVARRVGFVGSPRMLRDWRDAFGGRYATATITLEAARRERAAERPTWNDVALALLEEVAAA